MTDAKDGQILLIEAILLNMNNFYHQFKYEISTHHLSLESCVQ